MDSFGIRKLVSYREVVRADMGRPVDPPLVKAVVAAVIANPYAGRFVEDLSEAVAWSPELGTLLGGEAVSVLGEPPRSYGKAGIAGVAGEQEHAVMFITTLFGDALRAAVGGGAAWISSTSAVAAAGAAITVPLAHKDALYVRDQYDAIELRVPDAPRPDEVVVAVAVANRGRPHHRLGGLRAEDVVGADGLR